ncbi:hypothetical protein [Roseomonas rosulenta]|uniref:hypothetical protein n=1 Tax=Roseomonas rosulenta TaxID=2748667 RepID=UPI0018DF5CC1|nr:hypothetical protein [Roseomonas rosulenta]
MLLLNDPALLAGLLAGEDPDLAPAVPGPPAALPTAAPLAAGLPAATLSDAMLASATPAAATPLDATPPDATPPAAASGEAPPLAMVGEDAFPTLAELDALLADSYLPDAGIDRATRAELAGVFGLDPALIDDENAFMAALAGLEPPPEDDLPEPVSVEPPWDLAWVESVLEDWALG